MAKSYAKLFAAEIPLATELDETGLDKRTVAGGAGLSERWGNKGRFCSLTKECQRVCNWW